MLCEWGAWGWAYLEIPTFSLGSLPGGRGKCWQGDWLGHQGAEGKGPLWTGCLLMIQGQKVTNRQKQQREWSQRKLTSMHYKWSITNPVEPWGKS
jgi:hypothetical protein